MSSFGFGWIEACLRYAGRFGSREQVTYRELFDVSASSVSRHQDRVANALEEVCDQELFERDQAGRFSGGKLKLCENAKLPDEPVFSRVPSLDHWLQETFGSVYFHSAQVERADPAPDIIRPIVIALEDACPLRIRYNSRTGSRDREVSPHAIVKAVGRLHMRAYDHTRNRYSDFVLSRIARANKISDERFQYVSSHLDKDWNDFVKVEIKEKALTEPTATLGIRQDFSLDNQGTRIIRVRKALAKYIVDIESEAFSAPIEVRVRTSG